MPFLLKFYFYILKILIYFEQERARAGKGQRERESEIPSRFCTVSTEPDAGLDLMNSEIMA